MGPDNTCSSLWLSRTARLWPVKTNVNYLSTSGFFNKPKRTFYAIFLRTALITNSILGFFGITDHYITVNKDLEGGGGRCELQLNFKLKGLFSLPADLDYCHLQQRQTSGPQNA